jgi:hypothetical protein
MVKHKIVEKKALQIYVMKNLKITLIGNGFDRAHGLETSYDQFILWLIKEVILNDKNYVACKNIIHFIPGNQDLTEFKKKVMNVSSFTELSELKELKLPKSYIPQTTARVFKSSNSKPTFPKNMLTPHEYYNNQNPSFHELKSNNKIIVKCIENSPTENWSGIEHLYLEIYQDAIKMRVSKNEFVMLNAGFKFLKEQLIKYLQLKTLNNQLKLREDIISMLGLVEGKISTRHYYINYNYTPTLNQYLEHFGVDKKKAIHIHGSLENPEDIIFGYGSKDESVAQSIMNSNTYGLSNSKLLGVPSLRVIRDKLDKYKFDLNILGHSCSKSDGLSLSIFLKHKNLNSIRINARSEEEREALHKNLNNISQAESTRYFDREYKGTFNSKV